MKNKLISLGLISLGIAFILLVGTGIVTASSCARPTPAEALEDADAVFSNVFVVYSDKPSSIGLGVSLEEGESYLIYAYKSSVKEGPWITVCDVKKLSEAQDEIEELNNIVQPEGNQNNNIIASCAAHDFIPKQKYDSSDFVITGKVTEINLLAYPAVARFPGDNYGLQPGREMTFQVNKSWKGELNGEIKIYANGGSCPEYFGGDFTENYELLVFGKKIDNKSIVTDYKLVSLASQEMEYLNNNPNQPVTPQYDNVFVKFFKWLKGLFSKGENEPFNDNENGMAAKEDKDCSKFESKKAQGQCCQELHKRDTVLACVGGWTFDITNNKCNFRCGTPNELYS